MSGLIAGRIRGRGAVSNASGRFEAERRDAVDDGWARDPALEDADDAPPPLRTEVAEDASRTILARNTSPDVPFDRSINPYRGCEHGCVYCFARPSHAFLGLSPGLDFETRLTVKPNAAALLRETLGRRTYRPDVIAIGTNTDAYQPIERDHGVMRAILEVLEEHRHPVSIVTKSALITRDLDILGRMGRLGLARAALSITTLDRALARDMEPRAATPARRLEAIARLAGAGVDVGVMAAPVIPGLTDHELEAILEAAAGAGAGWAEYVTLRMPLEIKELFREWLEERRPHRAAKVLRGVRALHGGRDYDPSFGARGRGTGVEATLIKARFDAALRRFGLTRERRPLRTDLFRRPSAPAQGFLDL